MSENKKDILKKAQKSRKGEREVHIDLKVTKVAWFSIAILILVIAFFRIQNNQPAHDLVVISMGGAVGYRIYQTTQSKSWSDIIASLIFLLFFVIICTNF